MSETRDFPTAVIASLTTGVCLCNFADIHKDAKSGSLVFRLLIKNESGPIVR